MLDSYHSGGDPAAWGRPRCAPTSGTATPARPTGIAPPPRNCSASPPSFSNSTSPRPAHERPRADPAGVFHRPAHRRTLRQPTHHLLLPRHHAAAGESPNSASTPARPDRPARPRRRSVSAFLDHLEHTRHNTIGTRNARLAAIHSLYQFASLRHPEHAELIARVLAIPPSRHDRTLITHLTDPEIDALLNTPDPSTWIGRRDRTMLQLAIEPGCGSPSSPD